MPRGSKSKPQTNWSTTFVRCELTSDQKRDVPTWVKKNDKSLDDLVISLLQANYKLSYSFNDQTDSFICSITGKPEGCDNASKVLTAHAKDYGTALWVVLYKHYVLFKGEIWEELTDAEDFG